MLKLGGRNIAYLLPIGGGFELARPNIDGLVLDNSVPYVFEANMAFVGAICGIAEMVQVC